MDGKRLRNRTEKRQISVSYHSLTANTAALYKGVYRGKNLKNDTETLHQNSLSVYIRKKMKERILIGEEQQIRFRLNGSQNAEVLFDMTRPLGTLLINFEHDTDRGSLLRYFPQRNSLAACSSSGCFHRLEWRACRSGESQIGRASCRERVFITV